MVDLISLFHQDVSQTVISVWLSSGSPEGGDAERSVSGQTQPDGEERVKTGAGERERRPTDAAETTELRTTDQR